MLIARIVTGLLLGTTITVAILFLDTPAALAILGVLWIAGAWEWSGFARLPSAGRVAYAGALALPMAIGLVVPPPPAVIDGLLAVAIVGWGIAVLGVATFPRPIATAAVLWAGPAALLPSWFALGAVHALGEPGPRLALLVLALVWAADVGAYFVGRLLGRHKLAPRISPGKTWEGVAGGLALALLVAWAGALWLGVGTGLVAAIALATAAASIVGDLTVSMLKRNVGLKDSGRLLPGHGGVMDRIDGLVAAVPVFVVALRASGLASP